MNTQFRNRAFLPVVLPIALLGGIAVIVGMFALIMLYVDRLTAVALAFVIAAGVLVTATLLTSQDTLSRGKKGAAASAMVVPLLAGGLVASGVVGGIADEDRNINREPHGPQFVIDGLQDGVPFLAAESVTGFCLPSDGGCELTNEWSFEYDAATGEIAYGFDNREAVEHNLYVYAATDHDLAGLAEPIPLAELLDTVPLITPAEPPTISMAAQTYAWTVPDPAEAEEGAVTEIPEQAYFVCTIHPTSMWGVVTISEA